jgi:hypothetical protein
MAQIRRKLYKQYPQYESAAPILARADRVAGLAYVG